LSKSSVFLKCHFRTGGWWAVHQEKKKKQFLPAGSKDNAERFPDAEQRAALMSSCGKCHLPVVSKILHGEEERFYEPGIISDFSLTF